MYVWDEEAEDWVEADGAVPGETAETGLMEPGFWDTIFSGGFEGLQKLFSGKSVFGDLGKVLAAGGIGSLLNKAFSTPTGPIGYKGGIPSYTASVTQTAPSVQRPVTTTHDSSGSTVAVPYRPGQGGITYFNPIEYKYQGGDIKTPMADPTYTPPTPTPTPTGAHGGQVKAKRFDAGGPSEDPAPSWLTELVPQILNAQRAEPVTAYAAGGDLNSGIAMLAGGGRGQGRFLRGPGDGVSDSIPAKFEGSGNPARLADGEFVIDARTVSEIGNGSSEAGARKLYEMMDRVHAARKKATRGKPSKADKFLPK